MADGHLIQVEIDGQRYPIRTALDADYVTRLATFVDERMRAAARSTPSSDSLRLAVLTALNIADELFRNREIVEASHGHFNRRAEELERLLDRILMA